MWRIFKILIFITFLTPLAVNSYAQQDSYTHNLGHRGGSKHFTELPENSLILLEHSLRGGPYGESIQHHPDFQYLELDVRETLDHHLVVFHDKYLREMIPNSGKNNKTYKRFLSNTQFMERTGYKSRYREFQIQDLTLEEIKKFHLKGFPDQSVPTLEEYLSHARQFGLQKPVAIDVKTIQTHRTKYLLAAIATNFIREYLQKANIIFERGHQMIEPLIFIASPRSLKNFIPKDNSRNYWQNHEAENGIYIPVFHKGKHQGYLISFESETLLFFSEERSSNQSVNHEYITHQEPLNQCATALH